MNKVSRLANSPILPITLIVITALLIRTFGYGLYRVPSQSMEKTMLVGEFFFSNKLIFMFEKPKHSDIIAFNDPTYHYSENQMMHFFQRTLLGPSSWTKRVIGVPGDCVKGVIENGQPVIYRNNIKLDEPYITCYQQQIVLKESDEFNITLNANQYWVMGDNRCNSHDSRSFGPLDGALIHGKIVFRIASIDQMSLRNVITHPMLCWKSIRWDRCIQKVV